MPGLGPGGRRFESFHPDCETVAHLVAVSFFVTVSGFETVTVGMKGFGKPLFISLCESAPYGSLAALRDRGLVRRLTRSNSFSSAIYFKISKALKHLTSFSVAMSICSLLWVAIREKRIRVSSGEQAGGITGFTKTPSSNNILVTRNVF